MNTANVRHTYPVGLVSVREREREREAVSGMKDCRKPEREVECGRGERGRETGCQARATERKKRTVETDTQETRTEETRGQVGWFHEEEDGEMKRERESLCAVHLQKERNIISLESQQHRPTSCVCV